MSGFVNPSSGIAASIFLAIYTFYTPFMCFIIYKRGFETIFGFLWFFAIIRFGGQLCGVVYEKLGTDHWQWLIAYLVLGAEGYFALILAVFYTTCKAQEVGVGKSFLKESGPAHFNLSIPILSRLGKTWSAIFLTVLVPANVLLIIAGISLAGVTTEDVEQQSSLIRNSKVLRTIGQSMFLGLTCTAIIANIGVIWYQRVRNLYTTVALIAAPFLFVRGIFGVLSIYISSMNYFNIANYLHGLSSQVVMFEYVLGTTMELLASLSLSSPFLLDKKNPKNDWNYLDNTEKRVHV